ncbi:MAG: D-alanyl-D-alanine dipeptidase, partial [Planctomycetota bacterium]
MAGRNAVRFALGLVLALLLGGCSAGDHPPEDPRAVRTPDLVELVRLDATIKLDVRYATPDNFMKRPMYSEARAFLQRP